MSKIRIGGLTLEEIRELCEKATPLPWEESAIQFGRGELPKQGITAFRKTLDGAGELIEEEFVLAVGDRHREDTYNMEFISVSRTLIPALVEVVEKQTRMLGIITNEVTFAIKGFESRKNQVKDTRSLAGDLLVDTIQHVYAIQEALKGAEDEQEG